MHVQRGPHIILFKKPDNQLYFKTSNIYTQGSMHITKHNKKLTHCKKDPA